MCLSDCDVNGIAQNGMPLRGSPCLGLGRLAAVSGSAYRLGPCLLRYLPYAIVRSAVCAICPYLLLHGLPAIRVLVHQLEYKLQAQPSKTCLTRSVFAPRGKILIPWKALEARPGVHSAGRHGRGSG